MSDTSGVRLLEFADARRDRFDDSLSISNVMKRAYMGRLLRRSRDWQRQQQSGGEEGSPVGSVFDDLPVDAEVLLKNAVEQALLDHHRLLMEEEEEEEEEEGKAVVGRAAKRIKYATFSSDDEEEDGDGDGDGDGSETFSLGGAADIFAWARLARTNALSFAKKAAVRRSSERPAFSALISQQRQRHSRPHAQPTPACTAAAAAAAATTTARNSRAGGGKRSRSETETPPPRSSNNSSPSGKSGDVGGGGGDDDGSGSGNQSSHQRTKDSRADMIERQVKSKMSTITKHSRNSFGGRVGRFRRFRYAAFKRNAEVAGKCAHIAKLHAAKLSKMGSVDAQGRGRSIADAVLSNVAVEARSIDKARLSLAKNGVQRLVLCVAARLNGGLGGQDAEAPSSPPAKGAAPYIMIVPLTRSASAEQRASRCFLFTESSNGAEGFALDPAAVEAARKAERYNSSVHELKLMTDADIAVLVQRSRDSREATAERLHECALDRQERARARQLREGQDDNGRVINYFTKEAASADCESAVVRGSTIPNPFAASRGPSDQWLWLYKDDVVAHHRELLTAQLAASAKDGDGDGQFLLVATPQRRSKHPFSFLRKMNPKHVDQLLSCATAHGVVPPGPLLRLPLIDSGDTARSFSELCRMQDLGEHCVYLHRGSLANRLHTIAALIARSLAGGGPREASASKTGGSPPVDAASATRRCVAWAPQLLVCRQDMLVQWAGLLHSLCPDVRVMHYWGSATDRALLRQFWRPAHAADDDLFTERAAFHVVLTPYSTLMEDINHFHLPADSDRRARGIVWQTVILDDGIPLLAIGQDPAVAPALTALCKLPSRHRVLVTSTFCFASGGEAGCDTADGEDLDRGGVLVHALPLVSFLAPHLVYSDEFALSCRVVKYDAAGLRGLWGFIAPRVVLNTGTPSSDARWRRAVIHRAVGLAVSGGGGAGRDNSASGHDGAPMDISDEGGRSASSSTPLFHRIAELQRAAEAGAHTPEEAKEEEKKELAAAAVVGVDVTPLTMAMNVESDSVRVIDTEGGGTGADPPIVCQLPVMLCEGTPPLTKPCGRTYKSTRGLRKHQQQLHTPTGTWRCRYCIFDAQTRQACEAHESACRKNDGRLAKDGVGEEEETDTSVGRPITPLENATAAAAAAATTNGAARPNGHKAVASPDAGEVQNGKKQRPAKKKKVAGAKSAFMIFASELRPIIQRQEPGVPFGQISRKIGERWQKLSRAEREPYDAAAGVDKERYINDLVEAGDLEAALSATKKQEMAKKRLERKAKRAGLSLPTEGRVASPDSGVADPASVALARSVACRVCDSSALFTSPFLDGPGGVPRSLNFRKPPQSGLYRDKYRRVLSQLQLPALTNGSVVANGRPGDPLATAATRVRCVSYHLTCYAPSDAHDARPGAELLNRISWSPVHMFPAEEETDGLVGCCVFRFDDGGGPSSSFQCGVTDAGRVYMDVTGCTERTIRASATVRMLAGDQLVKVDDEDVFERPFGQVASALARGLERSAQDRCMVLSFFGFREEVIGRGGGSARTILPAAVDEAPSAADLPDTRSSTGNHQYARFFGGLKSIADAEVPAGYSSSYESGAREYRCDADGQKFASLAAVRAHVCKRYADHVSLHAPVATVARVAGECLSDIPCLPPPPATSSSSSIEAAAPALALSRRLAVETVQAFRAASNDAFRGPLWDPAGPMSPSDGCFARLLGVVVVPTTDDAGEGVGSRTEAWSRFVSRTDCVLGRCSRRWRKAMSHLGLSSTNAPLGSVDCHLYDDPSIGRHHVRIHWEPRLGHAGSGVYTLECLANKRVGGRRRRPRSALVRVNSKKVEPGESVLLESKALVQIGRCVFFFLGAKAALDSSGATGGGKRRRGVNFECDDGQRRAFAKTVLHGGIGSAIVRASKMQQAACQHTLCSVREARTVGTATGGAMAESYRESVEDAAKECLDRLVALTETPGLIRRGGDF